ncbi:MAG: guanylate kinase [Sphingomonadales bacterium]
MAENSKRRGLMLILSSPSGAGKTTLSRRLLEEDKETLLSISMTTRGPRPGEVNGEDYIFVTREEFDRRIQNNEFLEYANVFGNLYGTLKKDVDKILENGEDILFDIDWQGTQQILQKKSSDVVSVFILPPAISALRERLLSRGQDTVEQIEERMKTAHGELSHWPEYTYILVNRDFDKTLEEIKSILRAERKKRTRQPRLVNLVKSLMVQKI